VSEPFWILPFNTRYAHLHLVSGWHEMHVHNAHNVATDAANALARLTNGSRAGWMRALVSVKLATIVSAQRARVAVRDGIKDARLALTIEARAVPFDCAAPHAALVDTKGQRAVVAPNRLCI
jgi:hypothetical protein